MPKLKPKLNLCLVVFIDILGFKDNLRKINNQKDLEEIYNQLIFIQSEFGKNIDKEKKQDHQFAGKSVLAFSDCIVISLEFKSEEVKHLGSFDPFLSQLNAIGLSQAICACNNIFLRGGITIGPWFHRKDILISPALAEAYEIESQIAEFPMFTVSKRAYSFFKKHPHRNWYASEIDPIDFTFRKYRRSNGKYNYCIDYLKIGFDSSVDWYCRDDLERYKKSKSDSEKNRILSESYTKSQIEFLKYHKKAIQKALLNSPKNVRVKQKYEWLCKYHNKFINSLHPIFRECKIKD